MILFPFGELRGLWCCPWGLRLQLGRSGRRVRTLLSLLALGVLMRFIAVFASRTGKHKTADSRVVPVGYRQTPRIVLLLVLISLLLGNAAGVPSLRGQNETPYRPSPVIRRADWDFTHLIRLANTPGKGGSDLWPETWAKMATFTPAGEMVVGFERRQRQRRPRQPGLCANSR